jgi:hypothetical protein
VAALAGTDGDVDRNLAVPGSVGFLERKDLENLRIKPIEESFASLLVFGSGVWNTSSGGTFSPKVRVSLAIFFLRWSCSISRSCSFAFSLSCSETNSELLDV